MLGILLGNDPWFEPKSLGYGAGLPCAWQGWVLLGSYLAVILGLGLMVEWMGLVLFIAAVALVTIPLLWIVRRHTRGGWRWRG